MLYFDSENPLHLIFLYSAIALFLFCSFLLLYNQFRPRPVTLPKRSMQGLGVLSSPKGGRQDNKITTIKTVETISKAKSGLEKKSIQKTQHLAKNDKRFDTIQGYADDDDVVDIKSKDPEEKTEDDHTQDPLVEFLILAPAAAPRGSVFRIYVQLNNFDFERMDEQQSEMSEFGSIVTSIRADEIVGLSLQCSALFIDAPFQALNWDQESHIVVFNVRADNDEMSRHSDNTVFITIGGYPIGAIDFNISLYGAKTPAMKPEIRQNKRLTVDDVARYTRGLVLADKGFRAVRFSRAFISYSRHNTTEVLNFCQGLDVRGVQIDMDVHNFRAGEAWDTQAKELIDNCDVFFLMWSEEASQSEAVNKELEYALSRSKKKGIQLSVRPIVIKPSLSLTAPPNIPSNILRTGRFTPPIAT